MMVENDKSLQLGCNFAAFFFPCNCSFGQFCQEFSACRLLSGCFELSAFGKTTSACQWDGLVLINCPRSEFGELEISNTAWAFARIAMRDDRWERVVVRWVFCGLRRLALWKSSFVGWWNASLMLQWQEHPLALLVLEPSTASRAACQQML